MGYAQQSGGKVSFNEELDDSYARILESPMRSHCAILSALIQYSEQPAGQAFVADMPFKLVRHMTQKRGDRHHWQNTQENVFCVNSLVEYAQRYERDKPNMKVSASMADTPLGEAKFSAFSDQAITLRKPITQDDVGKETAVRLSKQGEGRLYLTTRLSYAPTQQQDARINAGMDIRKQYSVQRKGEWVLLEDLSEINRGELVRVDIYLSLPTARHFVVVEDPVPGGLEPINRHLNTASELDTQQYERQPAGSAWWFQFDDWRHYNASRWSFYHRELGHQSVRYYSDYLPAGNYHLAYVAQGIAAGDFIKMPVHAEEMYDPDTYGKGLSGKLQVHQEE
jgi:uncharacterized protein YfaS (alpha-2-macroglobulin family)